MLIESKINDKILEEILIKNEIDIEKYMQNIFYTLIGKIKIMRG